VWAEFSVLQFRKESRLAPYDSGNGGGRCKYSMDSRRHRGDDAMNYIEELKGVIGRLHGCEADLVETVPVIETFQGQTVWQGEVEVFNLRGHPKATRCYAWAYEKDDKGKR